MKKQLLSLSAAALFVVFLLIPAAASGTYEPVAAPPTSLCFSFDYPNEGSERITVNYRIPETACRFVSMSSDEKESAYGFDGSYIMQFDLSVDGENNWSHNPDWDSGEGDYIYLDVGVDTIGSGEFLWFTYDEAVKKCHGAIKSDKASGAENARWFDFENHSLFARARFVYFDNENGSSYCSTWSDTYSVNDSYNKTGFLFQENVSNLEPPIVKGAFLDDSDGDSLIFFDISLGGKLTDAAWAVKCAAGEDLTLKSQIRVNEGEWEYWSVEDELYPYAAGLRAFRVDDEMLDGKLEFRCRLSYEGGTDAGIDSFNSPWSKVILRTSDNNFSIVDNSDTDGRDASEKKCGLCGICPQPLGVCAFVWLTLAVIAVIVAIIIAKAIRRGNFREDTIQSAAKDRLEKGRAEDEARKTPAHGGEPPADSPGSPDSPDSENDNDSKNVNNENGDGE